MSTPEVIVVDPENPAESDLQKAAQLLRIGRIVAFPTETVYGLGANALDEKAVRRVFEAKGRPPTNPMIVHVASIEQAKELAATWPDIAERLARAFWPGPLTLVVGRGSQIGDSVTAGLPTFGVRMPAHPVALRLIELAGLPVAAPSANRYTEVSPTTAHHVVESLGDAVDLVIDGGPTNVGVESTVVAVDETGVTLLRPGMIDVAALEAVCGEVRRAVHSVDDDVARPSPGQSERHYSPRAEILLEGWNDGERLATDAALLFETGAAPEARYVAHMPGDAASYARRLYAELRAADAAGCERIIVEPPPADGAWEAIADRLRRARAEK